MEWRCEWCGKPHERDDPPCDNCGHGSFERAVVRQPAGESGPDSTTVWVCTTCGREHVKHSPPCSRCGSADLERREKAVDAEELNAPGYRDILTPAHALGLAVVAALLVLAALGAAGIVDIPGFGDDGVPEVSDVPGNATTANGFAHADIEMSYHDAIDSYRAENGADPLERSASMDEAVTYYNQRYVKYLLGSGDRPEPESVESWLPDGCTEIGIVRDVQGYNDSTTASAIGDALAERALAESEFLGAEQWVRTGIDVHSADGQVILSQFVCD